MIAFSLPSRTLNAGRPSDDAASDLAKVGEFAKHVASVDATYKKCGSDASFTYGATVELDSQKIKSVPIRDLSLGDVAIDLHGEFYDGGMIVTVEMQDMTPIQSELVRSDENIYCIKFSDPNITSTAKLKCVIDDNAAKGGAGGSEGVE